MDLVSNNPLTGEWTAESVQKMFGWKYKKRAEAVAKAHNAALAAEREKANRRDLLSNLRNDDLYKEIQQLREQLAAAVDYWQGVATQEWHKGFASGTEQLATEREKYSALKGGEWTVDAITKLSEIRDELLALAETIRSNPTLPDQRHAVEINTATNYVHSAGVALSNRLWARNAERHPFQKPILDSSPTETLDPETRAEIDATP